MYNARCRDSRDNLLQSMVEQRGGNILAKIGVRISVGPCSSHTRSARIIRFHDSARASTWQAVFNPCARAGTHASSKALGKQCANRQKLLGTARCSFGILG